MSGRITPSRVRADHCRQLAQWTDDERTHHILMEMARELEEGEGRAAEGAPRDGDAPGLPRSLS
ncbi:MAG TPA: hypothetical protein VMG08_02425 [Allosphingosinicella sp.]|nr:hypothetical protein [Allosphingosinicella sp.]